MQYSSELQSAFDQHAEHLERCFRALVEYRRRCQEAQFAELENLANLAQFVLILQYDLRIHGSDFEATNRRWRRNLYARQIATTLFESIEDLTKLCGRALTGELVDFAPQDTLEKLQSTLRGLRSFRRSHSTTLKEIREVISAHRDHNAQTQITTMKNIDIDRILDLNADYILWLNDLLSIIDDTIVHSFADLEARSNG